MRMDLNCIIFMSASDLTEDCWRLAFTAYVKPRCGGTRPAGAELWACPLGLAVNSVCVAFGLLQRHQLDSSPWKQ